jgi:WD40 repeat protein
MSGTGHPHRFAVSACGVAGLRLSRVRHELLRRLAEAPSPSVVEPFVREHARLLKAHPVTVYRFLGELLAAHVLQQVTVAGRRAVILSCRSANWLVCARCGVLRPLPEPEVMPEWKGAYLGVAWSPDGSHLAATTLEGTVIYWRLPFREEEPLQMSGYEGKVRALAWDRGSRWLATAGGDRVTVWDVSGSGPAGTRPLLLEGHAGRVGVLEFAPRGAILASGANDGSLFLWNTAAGEQGVTAGRMGAAITALAWAREGGRLAAGTAAGEVQILC